MTPSQVVRLAVFERWLRKPDEFDRLRRSRITVDGKPERFHLLNVQPAVHRTTVLVDRENERLQ